MPITPRLISDSGDAALRLALEGAAIVRLADAVLAEPIRKGLLVGGVDRAHRCPRPVIPRPAQPAGKIMQVVLAWA